MSTINVNIYNLDITVTNSNIHIVDSYKVHSRHDMCQVLNALREYLNDFHPSLDTPLAHRSNKSLCNEWVTHNNAYKLGYKVEQSKDVDLNWPQPWYASIVYWFCSIIVL